MHRKQPYITATSLYRAVSIVLSTSMLSACGDSSTVLTRAEPGQTASQVTAPTQTENSHQHSTPASVRFTSVADDIWPPQPRNATNLQRFAQAATGISNQTSAVKRAALNNPQVAASLGDDFQDFASTTRTMKNGENQTTLEFYNYTTDEAIQIEVASDSSIRINKSDASQYQPPESQSEKAAAINIAANALRTDGFADLDQYQGTAMLAYPTASEVAVSGNQFYQQRMLYVTFGVGSGELPAYRALVNLNTQTAVSRGPIQ